MLLIQTPFSAFLYSTRKTNQRLEGFSWYERPSMWRLYMALYEWMDIIWRHPNKRDFVIGCITP